METRIGKQYFKKFGPGNLILRGTCEKLKFFPNNIQIQIFYKHLLTNFNRANKQTNLIQQKKLMKIK
jgi:hypothetical protein